MEYLSQDIFLTFKFKDLYIILEETTNNTIDNFFNYSVIVDVVS